MFNNPFSYNGRIQRLEYSISLIISLILLISIDIFCEDDILLTICTIPIIWFMTAQATKREHDLNFSGWWQFIPFRYFWLMVIKGNDSVNKYNLPPSNQNI